MQSIKKYIAECLGTFVLVFVACGAAAILGCDGSVPNAAYFMTAAAFGLVIVAMAYSVGNISGCHINPAVSIAMFCAGKLSLADFIGYVVSQFVGGILGGAALRALLGGDSGLGTNGLYKGEIVPSIIVEIVLTFIFVFAILGVTSKIENGSIAGLVIGGTLTLVHLFGIHFTGTSVNPARSLGPAIFVDGDALKCVWVFIVAPLVGGVLAALVHMLLNGKEETDA